MNAGSRHLDKKQVRLVVLIPAGPRDDILDTVDSVSTYVGESTAIAIIDDTGQPGIAEALVASDDRVTVLPSPGGTDTRGALFVRLADAYRYLVEHYRFRALLRLDADALVIAPRPEDLAIDIFNTRPALGMLGSHRFDCNGNPRRFVDAERYLRREAGLRGMGRPRRRALLRSITARAAHNGYRGGEHCLGAAYFHSFACVEELCRREWFGSEVLKQSVIPEDHLFGLATIAAGFQLGDYATGDLPLGVQWQGLPASPGELRRRNKKIIHSVRFWGELGENDIRSDFARERRAARVKAPRKGEGSAPTPLPPSDEEPS